jgi:hypothetical protein
MDNDTKSNDIDKQLDAIISKNSLLNRFFFGITLICLIVGVVALLSRQKDLIAGSRNLAIRNDSLNKDLLKLYAENSKLKDSTSYYAVLLKNSSNKLADQKSWVLNITNTNRQSILTKSAPPLLIADNIKASTVQDLKSGTGQPAQLEKKTYSILFSFDVKNNYSSKCQTDLFVRITPPDGVTISTPAWGSGTFTTRDNHDLPYTAKLPIEIDGNAKQTLQFALKQNSPFQNGDYTIEIFNRESKIGETVVRVKKRNAFDF